MLVIKGKSGKVKIVREKLATGKWASEKTLIVHSPELIGYHSVPANNIFIIDNLQEAIDNLKVIQYKLFTELYDRLVLAFEAVSKLDLKITKEFEQELMKLFPFREIVITVQSDDEEIKIIEI